MGWFDVVVAFIQGVVEGITEWLPISSTGHMILVEQFLNFKDENFAKMFLVVVQLGAILAVVVLFWKKIFPFEWGKKDKTLGLKRLIQVNGFCCGIKEDIFILWGKILVACIPAAVVGIMFDEQLDKIFYHPEVVASALIVYGILFIVAEVWNKGKQAKYINVNQITFNAAIIIGLFQLSAAVIPGTSRSGATILGALMIGIGRAAAAEFTFYLAIPVMFGASLLKIAKFIISGGSFDGWGAASLFIGMFTAFVVSMLVIRFLMGYIRKHDFKVFGYYRIVLGTIVLFYAAIIGFR